MSTVVEWLIAIGLGLVLLWLALLVALLIARPRGGRLREAIRLAPDVIRLLTRLAKTRAVPRRARIWLWLLLGYLAMPIDIVPDFIPVIGYADDAVVVALVLRMVVRHTGAATIREHWPGTPDGLAAIERLAGVGEPLDDDQKR